MKNYIVRISLSDNQKAAVDALIEKYRLANAHDLFRYLLAKDFESSSKIDMRYSRAEAPSRIAKRERDAAYEKLIAMDGEEMTIELVRIGYIEEPEYQSVAVDEESGGYLALWYKKGGVVAREPIESHLNKIKANLKKYYP